MQKDGIIITIDGFVATGKGTTAIGVAEKLKYRYLDTGAMYRALALYALENNLLKSSEADKQAMLKHIELKFVRNEARGKDHIHLNGRDIEDKIRDPQLSSQMKPIVTSPTIRQRLGQEQKRIGHNGGIIVDGRDMGTVVFPQAELKLFLVGDKTIRAHRRHKEMIARGRTTTLEDIIKDIDIRDHTDYLGDNAVNHKADDAIEIDTSVLTIDEQIEQVYQLALQKLNQSV